MLLPVHSLMNSAAAACVIKLPLCRVNNCGDIDITPSGPLCPLNALLVFTMTLYVYNTYVLRLMHFLMSERESTRWELNCVRNHYSAKLQRFCTCTVPDIQPVLV